MCGSRARSEYGASCKHLVTAEWPHIFYIREKTHENIRTFQANGYGSKGCYCQQYLFKGTNIAVFVSGYQSDHSQICTLPTDHITCDGQWHGHGCPLRLYNSHQLDVHSIPGNTQRICQFCSHVFLLRFFTIYHFQSVHPIVTWVMSSFPTFPKRPEPNPWIFPMASQDVGVAVPA